MVQYHKMCKVYNKVLQWESKNKTHHAILRAFVRVVEVSAVSLTTVHVSLESIPDNLNSSSDAILTDMSWEKRSFWGQANVSGRLLIGSLFSLAPKVLKARRWETGGVSSAGGGSTSMGSTFTFTFWYWASLLFSGEESSYWLDVHLNADYWTRLELGILKKKKKRKLF